MLIPALAIVDTLALVGVAVAIGRKFFVTRDRGFLWLLVALVVWPVAQIGMFFAYNRWVDSVPSIGSLAPGELVSVVLYSLDLVERSLLIVAIFMLYRGSKTSRRTDEHEVSTVQLNPSPEPNI
jgi:hypothetical protein